MSLLIEIDDLLEGEENAVDLFEGQESFASSDSSILSEGVSLNGVFRKVGKEYYFEGQAKTSVALECARCAEAFGKKVETPVIVHYIPVEPSQKHADDVELKATDIDCEIYSGGEIDMTQAVYDQIILSLPMVRLCREDCLGLCSRCGQNRNEMQCTCREDENADIRFAVLQNLKDKLETS